MSISNKRKIGSSLPQSGQKGREKKAVKLIFAGVAAVIAVLLVVLGVLSLLNDNLEEEKFDFTASNGDIYFFPADYNANPADDPAYMAKERRVWFEDDGGVGYFLDEADGKTNTVRALFYNYFQSLVKGDATSHSSYLSKAYKENFVVQERFTPQKVHTVNVKFNQGETRDGVALWHYQVSYKIYENNGTYRSDIGSETARVMNFEIVYENDSYKINSIGYVSIKDSNAN